MALARQRNLPIIMHMCGLASRLLSISLIVDYLFWLAVSITVELGGSPGTTTTSTGGTNGGT
jgi:hypothetical protein